MTNLSGYIRNNLEKLSGFYIDRVAKSSFILTNQKYRRHAWASSRCQLRSILDQFSIDLVIDAGANEGQFAIMLRKFYQGEIHSFEPVSSTYDVLSKTSDVDPTWHTHHFALGSEESEQEINVSNFSVFSSLLKPNSYSSTCFSNKSATVKKEEVSIRRLDDVLQGIVLGDERRKIFLKMDTQGFDLEVFKGLGRWGRDVYALQTELSVIPIYDGMPHWTDCILEFEKAGYSVAGMFPVSRNSSLQVIEFDCMFVRAREG